MTDTAAAQAPKEGGAWMGKLQLLQLGVTIALAVAGFMLQQRTQQMSADVQRLDQQLKLRQEDRAEQERQTGLRIKLYDQVLGAVDKPLRQQQAARALVTALLAADDPLRGGLLEVLLQTGAAEERPVLEKQLADEHRYAAWRVEAANEVQQAAAANATRPADDPKAYVVDVFYCAGPAEAALKAKAEAARELLVPAVQRARVRALAEPINASPGYHVAGLQIRHDASELAAARRLSELLASGGQGAFAPHAVAGGTPRYLSVFVCS